MTSTLEYFFSHFLNFVLSCYNTTVISLIWWHCELFFLMAVCILWSHYPSGRTYGQTFVVRLVMRHEYKDPGTQDAHSLEMRLQRRNTIGIVR